MSKIIKIEIPIARFGVAVGEATAGEQAELLNALARRLMTLCAARPGGRGAQCRDIAAGLDELGRDLVADIAGHVGSIDYE